MFNGLNSKGGAAKVFFLTAVLSAVVLFLILGYGRTNIYSDKHKAAEFCGSCHEMEADYHTWQASSHSEILCTRCHTNTSPTMIALKYFTFSYNTPVKVNKFIDDTDCLSCHRKQILVSPPGDLIIPHQLHLEKKIDCVDCHSYVAHGNILETKLVTGDLKPEQVTTEIGAEQMKIHFQVKMDVCMQCHNGAKAPNDCQYCHKVLRQPKK